MMITLIAVTGLATGGILLGLAWRDAIMARDSSPKQFQDIYCADGGTPPRFGSPETPTHRSTVNLPKELQEKMAAFSEESGIAVGDQVARGVDMFLKVHADEQDDPQNPTVKRLVPSRTHGRLIRICSELNVTEGWPARLGVAAIVQLMETEGRAGKSLFQEAYDFVAAAPERGGKEKGAVRPRRIPDLIAHAVRRYLDEEARGR